MADTQPQLQRWCAPCPPFPSISLPLSLSLSRLPITYNAAISTCEKAGEWARDLQFLEGMANSRVEAHTITYSAAISACEKAGEWVRALQLLQGMANSRVEADTITYNAS